MQEDTLPPPFVGPVYACTEVVTISGCLTGAQAVVVDSNGAVLGTGTATPNGRASVSLANPLSEGTEIRAFQLANGVQSEFSSERIVRFYNERLPAPRIDRKVWECGRKVGTKGAVEGARMSLIKASANNNPVETRWPSKIESDGQWAMAHDDTPQGSDGDQVRVKQIMCPQQSGANRIESPTSEPATVKQAPRPMPELEKVRPIDETTNWRIRGTFVGAQNNFFKDGNQFGTLLRAEHEDYRSTGNEVLDTSMHNYAASHSLCAESSRTAADPIPFDEFAEGIETVDVEKPCPNSNYIRAKASDPAGRLILEIDGRFASQASARDGFTRIGLPSSVSLRPGDDITVRHVLRNYREVANGSTEVSDQQKRLEVLGAETFTSQDDGSTVTGFVRESSRGPKFVYRDCCPGYDAQQPRSVQLNILRRGSLYSEVTLEEKRPGYFVGRWDFFKADFQTEDGVWPPPANYEYTARIQETPCSEQPPGDETFRVLTGDADSKDSTAPSSVELVLDPGGVNAAVTASGNNQSVKVEPGTEFPVALSAFDRQGISKIEFDAPSGTLDSPTTESAGAKVPIPPELNLETTFLGIRPFETVDITGVGENFAGDTEETAVLTVEGKHPKPQIDSITPDTLYPARNMPTIKGEDLYYRSSALTTEIVFSIPTLGIRDEVLRVSPGNTRNPSPSELALKTIPNALLGEHGKVEVQVRTFETGDRSTAETSNTETFWLLDRDTTFEEFKHDDFTDDDSTITQCPPPSPPRGAITDVRITDASKRPQEALATFTYEKDGNANTHNVAYNRFDGEGGVLVGPECRTAVVLSHDKTNSGNGNEQFFIAQLRYFAPSGQVTKQNGVGANLAVQTNNNAFLLNDDTKGLLSVFISGAGTIVSVGEPNPKVPNTQNQSIAGSIQDMYVPVFSNNSVRRAKERDRCGGPCSFTSEWPMKNSTRIELLVDGTVFEALNL